MQTNSQAKIVKKYFSFLNEIGRRLRQDSYGVGMRWKSPLMDRFPGVAQLLNSLVSASPTARKVRERFEEDWNPFSQRIVLSDEKPPTTSEVEKKFTLLTTSIQTFIEWCHEAIHVLALEPFFCGSRKIASKEDFVLWSLANEALGFWYADMVMTSKIREYIPAAELIYNRCSVSNVAFHPEQVFKKAGVKSLEESLEVYIKAFLDKQSKLQQSQNIYARVLTRQLRGFYQVSRINLSSWYTILDDFDFFEGYYTRFCDKPNLPSLFDSKFLKQSAELEFSEYAIQLGMKHLPALKKLNNQQITAINLRRHVQTRAYFAWFLLHAIRKDWVFCLADQFDGRALCSALELYLDRLEAALGALAPEGKPKAILAQLQEADQGYEQSVQEMLLRSRAYIKYRYRVFPFFAPTDGIVGLSDDRSNYSEKEMVEVIRFILKRHKWGDGDLLSAEDNTVELLNNFLRTVKDHNLAEIKKRFNELMCHPKALAIWSVQLSDIKPSENQFKEMVFEYT